MHTARMEELNAAVARFFAVLDPAWASRVTFMTFSEFGRTSWDNDGQGTDHGSSAPHFVIGQNVQGGLYGQRPSLAGLGRWERMQHHVDFRSYYASIIDGWLGGGSTEVLGGTFENLGLFAAWPGHRIPDGSVAPAPAVVHAAVDASCRSRRSGWSTPVTAPAACSTGRSAPGEPIRVPIAGVGPVPADRRDGGRRQRHRSRRHRNRTSSPSIPVDGATRDVEPQRRPRAPGAEPGRDGRRPRRLRSRSSTRAATAHCLVDVFGYFTTATGDRFTPVTPARLFDTRNGTGIRPGKVPTGTPIEVQVAGLAGVPATGASAVVMNLTVTEPESRGLDASARRPARPRPPRRTSTSRRGTPCPTS